MLLGPNHSHPEKNRFCRCLHPISETGWTCRIKVPLEIRLKSTRPSHGRFYSLYIPPEAGQKKSTSGALKKCSVREFGCGVTSGLRNKQQSGNSPFRCGRPSKKKKKPKHVALTREEKKTKTCRADARKMELVVGLDGLCYTFFDIWVMMSTRT